MGRVGLTWTWAVCGLAAVGTAGLGSASGLFRDGVAGPGGLVAAVSPYVLLALLAWGQRHRPASLGLVLGVAVLVGGYGLFFFFNDWYWPRPTHPNPWRAWMIPVVVVPQWVALGLAVVILAVGHIWSTPRRPVR
jgi:hypothetical protein